MSFGNFIHATGHAGNHDFPSTFEVHKPLIEIVGCGDTLDLMEILHNAPDGNFVTTDYTLRYCRDNIRSGLFVADSMDDWQKKLVKTFTNAL